MRVKKFSLKEAVMKLEDPWSPVEVVKIGSTALRLAIFEGEYHWHQHAAEDELFLILDGTITIQTRQGDVLLESGDAALVPRGLAHRPMAVSRAAVILIEPATLISQGQPARCK